MMLHGSPTPKPTLLLSPMCTISQMDLGPLRKAERQARTRLQTVRLASYNIQFDMTQNLRNQTLRIKFSMPRQTPRQEQAEAVLREQEGAEEVRESWAATGAGDNGACSLVVV